MLGLLVILRGCPAPVGKRGERDRIYEGGGDLTQPPANFLKFLVSC